jgi:hypothetical protein
VPGLDVAHAVQASQTQRAAAALGAANTAATESGVNSTPSFLLGRAGGALRLFQPASLTAESFSPELNALIGHGA